MKALYIWEFQKQRILDGSILYEGSLKEGSFRNKGFLKDRS